MGCQHGAREWAAEPVEALSLCHTVVSQRHGVSGRTLVSQYVSESLLKLESLQTQAAL